MAEWWEYDQLPSRAGGDWRPASKGDRPWDQLDFHMDLGCGRVPKGRLGIDLRPTPGATELCLDLNELMPPFDWEYPDATPEQQEILRRSWDRFQDYGPRYKGYGADDPEGRRGFDQGMPFPDNSIKSIISHHALEHIGVGFEMLMNECYRILEPHGVFRIIVPLFPSTTAVSDYDHKRYFMEGTWHGFTGVPDGTIWSQGFAEPYNDCRFHIADLDCSPPTPLHLQWTDQDAREMRATLVKWDGRRSDYRAEEYMSTEEEPAAA